MLSIRSIVTVIVGTIFAVGLCAPPVVAGQQVTGVYSRHYPRTLPRFYFTINIRAAQDSRLTLYYSSRADRVRRYVTVRAGSGRGALDECAKSRGPLPTGRYSVWFKPNYLGGNPVIRGDVWRLSDHVCRNRRTVRDDLFIHTSGVSGAPFHTYRTHGCIRVDQADRAKLARVWRSAWANRRGELVVRRS